MNYKNILTSKFDFLHFLKIILIEFIFIVTIYYCYAIFSMLFFGEGASSFMYSKTNTFIYLGLIILPPIIFNIVKFFRHIKNGQLSKSKNYFLLETILLVVFICFFVFGSPVTF